MHAPHAPFMNMKSKGIFEILKPCRKRICSEIAEKFLVSGRNSKIFKGGEGNFINKILKIHHFHRNFFKIL